MHDQSHATEVARIEAAYRARDAGGAASAYRFSNPGYAFHMQALESALLEAVRRSPVKLDGANVLDVGCGSGYLLHRLVEFGAGRSTGVDLMPGRIEAARSRYPGIRFTCADAANLPFERAEFDIVTQFTCFSSVLEPGLRSAIAAEMWRVLRPGGVVISYDMRPPPWPVRAMRAAGEWRRRGQETMAEGATPTTSIAAEELHRLFPDAALHYEPVGLAFGVCGVAARSTLAAQFLAGFRVLREHAIGLAVKPPSRPDDPRAAV